MLLFGAGKSATVLIDYLIREAAIHNWLIIIADADKEQALAKTGGSPLAEAVQIDIKDAIHRASLIRSADIVISMMPPTLHFLVAKDCVTYSKNLLTASYLDDPIRSLQAEIEDKRLLFLGEMGLDPGIDHMSAMRIIDDIKTNGGAVNSFKSHCGGLVAPESDDNPWHYKISWNPRNVVNAGKAGAEYRLEGVTHHLPYATLFENCTEVNIPPLGNLAIYPNRDSLSYLPVYQLENSTTFLRTTLRYPSFCTGWQAIVQSGLAGDLSVDEIQGLTFADWSVPILPFVNDQNRNMLQFLGLFDKELVPGTAKTSADILQYLLETKLAMQPADKDMIVMLHEIGYEQAGKHFNIESSLIVKGEDSLRTAMAKTVGLPLGIAAKLILTNQLNITGLHIPTIKEIYEPVLAELEKVGIAFTERRV